MQKNEEMPFLQKSEEEGLGTKRKVAPGCFLPVLNVFFSFPSVIAPHFQGERRE
jgi:hypothetical protein